MSQSVKILDRVMFGGLLLLVIFLPYSSAMIEFGLLIMILAWFAKRSVLFQKNPKVGVLGSYGFPSSGLKWPLIIIGALIVLTMPFSQDPSLSLKKFFSIFIQQILLAYITFEIINSPKRLYIVMAFFLSTLVVVNLDVLIQHLSGESFIFSNRMYLDRVNGPMKHPNDLGTLIVLSLPVILSLILTRRSWVPLLFVKKWTGVIAVLMVMVFLLSLYSLGLTASRGAWLAFIVSSIGYGIYLKNYRLSAVIILMLVLFFLYFGTRFLNTRTDIHVAKNQDKVSLQLESFINADGRLTYWQAAMDMIKQSPVFGCGYNAYIQRLRRMNVGHEEYPHNSILHITAESGILGLLAYLWFFAALFLVGIKTLKKISIHKDLYILGCGVCFGIIAWFIHSLLDTPWESLRLKFLWWLFIGILLSLGKVFEQFKLVKDGG